MMCPYCGAETPDELEICQTCHELILEEDTDVNLTPEEKRRQMIVTYVYLIGTTLFLAGAFYFLAKWTKNLFS